MMTNAMQWQEWPENGPGEEYHEYELVVWVPCFRQSYIARYEGSDIGTDWPYEGPDIGTGWVIDLNDVWRHIYDGGEFEVTGPHQITHFAAITPPEDTE